MMQSLHWIRTLLITCSLGWVARVYDAIRTIRDNGVTLLIVEQNVSQALSIADRAYVIQHGRVVLEGTGHELAQNPEVQSIYLGIGSTRR